MWDIFIENVRLVDPAAGLDAIGSVAIKDGLIDAAGESLAGEARLTIRGDGMLLTPGLADIHAHIGGKDFAPLSLPADDAGIHRGVTCIADAGTAGAANADALLERTRLALTEVRHFLNVYPTGIAALPERWTAPIDFAALEESVRRHRPRLAGIKLRLMSDFAGRFGPGGLESVKNFAENMGLPLMLHLGTDWEDPLPPCWEKFCCCVLSILGKGDILSHCYTAKPGGVITPDRRFYTALRQAAARGVILDAAVALSHFSFQVARQGMADGFMPDCISTDLTRNNGWRGVLDLPAVMSRFLALGMPLADVVRCSATVPHAILGVPCPGITVGAVADLSLMIDKAEPVVLGTAEESMPASRRLLPFAVINGGRFFSAKPGEEIPV